MKRAAWLAFFLGSITLSSQAWAQVPCGTECYQAASCAAADVQTAVDAALASAGGTVRIPDPASGTCDWTKPVVIDATKKPIHVRGQSEQTTRVRALGQAFSVDAAPDVAWEISDLEISDGTCAGQCDTIIGIGGAGATGRAHHLRFDTTGIFLRLFRSSGSAHPLIDHVTVRGTTPSEFLTADGANWVAWKGPVDLGSAEAVFVEDCDIEFTGQWEGRPFDGEMGGRMVVRHNRIKNHMLGNHGFDSGFGASMFSVVGYANDFSFADDVAPWTSATWSRFTHFRGGTGLLYDNTFTVGTDIWIGGSFDLAIYRTPTDSGGNESWQPCNGTAYRMCSNVGRDWTILSGDHPYNCVTDQDCVDRIGAGTTCKWKLCSVSRMELCEIDGDCPLGETCTSNLDGAGAEGYPCFMQPGYATQMHRYPWYEWNNTWTGGQGGSACATPPCDVDFGANVSQLVEGRDYFDDVPQGGALPASCAPDDAFWIASESTLYRCAVANTWAAYYKQYPYPHPLQTGSTPVVDGGPDTSLLDAPLLLDASLSDAPLLDAGAADGATFADTASEEQGGGCGCRTAGTTSVPGWPVALLGLTMLIRRRARSLTALARLAPSLALVALSLACSSEETVVPGSPDASGSGAAGGTGGGGGAPGTGGAAGASGGATADGSIDAQPDRPTPFSCPDGGVPSGFHVAPTGTPSGDGSAQSPWDLATALAQPSTVRPGATLWLHDGVYKGTFTSALTGDSASPITVSGYPGEHPVLDGVDAPNAQVLTINGAYSVFRDFEVMSSFATRVITSTGSNPPDARGSGIGMYAPGAKVVDLVIHDTGVGVGNWSPASDGEVYGCIIYYNGWDAPDRGHGHGIYAQNQTGKKYLTDNIIFRQFSYGIHGYTEGGKIDNFDVEGNIVFNNGEPSQQSGFATDILVGGLQIATSPTLNGNATYFPTGEGGNNVGYSAGCTDATITDNYLVAGTALTIVQCTGTTTLTGNTFVGAIAGFTAAGYPGNTYAAARPTGSHVVVRPNKYDAGRAHIAVFNWDNLDTVPVDVSSVLAAGDAYELLDAQDLFGAPVLRGVQSGGSLAVPMTHTAVTTPVGNVPVAITHTSKEFGAFLLRKLCP